jgi:predicted phosphodiesterase
MEFSAQEVADTIGINRCTVGKAIRRHFVEFGCLPPGVSHDRKVYTDEFVDWFASRPYARPELQGLKRDGSYTSAKTAREMGEPMPRVSGHVAAVVTGLTPASRIPSKEEMWEDAERIQLRDKDKIALRYSQEVLIPDEKPVLLVLLSDAHFGDAHTDYIQARKDAELVRDNDGVFAAFLGDLVDAWISPSLSHIQREQPMTLHRELMLAESWLVSMSDKLIAVVSGNHDLRVYTQSGLDLLANMLSRVTCLYDQHEINFTMKLGAARWRWKLRHEWKHRSQNNPSNPMEYDARWNDGTWDFAVGGHDHTPTLLRPFIDSTHDGRKKAAIKIGCYSTDSSYGRELNRERIVTGGSLGIMLWPDGDWQEFYSLEKAVRFLAMERAR